MKRDDVSPSYWQTRAAAHLQTLCAGRDRRPGSVENQASTTYVTEILGQAGWSVSWQEFDVIGWEGGDGALTVSGTEFRLRTSPYSLGVDATGRLIVAQTLEALGSTNITGAIVILTGALTAQPLTPKAFPFYQVEEHAHLIELLEAGSPAAIVVVTGWCPAAAGALRPFPFVEDGDFGIPAAYVDESIGAALARYDGSLASIRLEGQRISASARNVIGRRGQDRGRITIVAHIDTKVGTPGALDNASGVTVVLLLAEMFASDLSIGVELLVVNGEDYYNAAGEVHYLQTCGAELGEIALAVNLDGLGFHEGRTAYSLYGCNDQLATQLRGILDRHGLVEGPQWWQGDHAVFSMQGRPAIALTSEYTDRILQEIAHTSRDTPTQVDDGLLVQAATALYSAIEQFPRLNTQQNSKPES